MACCSLDSFGYRTDFQKNLVRSTGTAILLSAVAGVAVGVLGLYNVISPSTALWAQVGLFSAVAVLTGVTVALSDKIRSKVLVLFSVITLLVLPVLFGSLGAMKVIPPHDMLWAASSLCGIAVATGFVISTSCTLKECITNKAH